MKTALTTHRSQKNQTALMKVISINVGLPREVQWQGETVLTSIFKTPVSGCVRVGQLNLDGDQQADLSVHGGTHKAVYAYPAEHYPFWRTELPATDISWGAFGENLTTEGLLEDTVHIGDRLRIGSAEFVVTQPRMPCFKLAIRFNQKDIVKHFLQSGRTGFYLSIALEGEIRAGDPITLLARDTAAVSVADIFGLRTGDAANQDILRRASELSALPASLRDVFRKRLWDPDVK